MENQQNFPHQATKPRVFDVHFVGPFGLPKIGKFELRIDHTHIELRARCSRKQGTIVALDDLREVYNQVPEKGILHANFGTSSTPFGEANQNWILKLDHQRDREPLNEILGRLPAAASAKRCPNCSGPVIDDECSECRTSYSGSNRRSGLVNILTGITLIAVGIALTLAQQYLLFWGAIVGGLFFIVQGAIRLMSGKRFDIR